MPNDKPESPDERDLHVRIEPGEVNVWSISIQDCRPDVNAMLAMLVRDEVERAGRFVFEKDRNTFVVGRAMMRGILGHYLAIRPQDIPIVLNDYGKPELESKALFFNVSHSGDLVLVAACRNHPIGVDVECIRPVDDVDQLITQYFSPREARELRGLPHGSRLPAFFACWTRKEAYVKARGQGLSLPLDEFDVPTDVRSASNWHSVDTRDSPPWFIVALPVREGYSGALASSVGELTVRYRECSPRWCEALTGR